ncbi:DUF1295 domain-containing protein [Halanaerobiaceae bacterium Z-7014]|uniref:DUF1295 domain-containing protein n=1 Tax=Halonatronomonas betaini TaxID=2778430 RepID=A0A931AU02_9FIRM|nr:methyltransferase [Halonatronomonas betaini]MBF8436126.1 DUF1295 domain-containing protein [Halonatronomonas betaini]
MNISQISFYIALISGIILIIGIIIDLKNQKINLWPITEASLFGIIELTIWHVFYIATVVFAILTAIPLIEFSIINWVGLILFIIGFCFSIWAIIELNIKESYGVKGEFCSTGPYKYCRNPQSTGIIIHFLGAVLFTYSVLMIILTLIHMILLILLVFAEEPWLHEKYGQDYLEYKEQVPYRFIPYIY